jgi:peptide/nickel transport system substrate-binding protein
VSWDTNGDKSSWTFKLRPNVTFSDGTPFDAQAVKTAYVRTITLSLGTGQIIGTFLPKPEQQIVVVDPMTVRFDLGRPVAHFDVVLASQYGLGIASPAVFKNNSTGPKDQGHAWLQNNAVGTGPYLLQTLKPNDRVVLVQNPTYWGGWSGNHFKQIIILNIPEASTRLNLLRTGGADIVFKGTSEDTASVRTDDRFFVQDGATLAVNYIILGDYGPLAPPAARQAMNYLFPTQDFITSVAKDRLTLPKGVFPEQLFTHDPNVFTYTPDVAKAKQLLAEAGVAPGTTLTYEYFTGSGKDEGLVLQSQLAQVGITLKLLEKDYSTVNADMTTDRPVAQRANMYFFGWWPDYNDPSDFSWILFDSNAAPDKCACYNSGYYHNAQVDQIIEDGFKESDDTKLIESFKTAQDILIRQDPAWIPTGGQLQQSYFRNDVKGEVSNPLYTDTFNYYALSRG